MFHVSTLLPFTPNDPQQVERKRHIGKYVGSYKVLLTFCSDVLVIVFKDTDSVPFDPMCVTSDFNRILLYSRLLVTNKTSLL
jgi:hypothetical protein